MKKALIKAIVIIPSLICILLCGRVFAERGLPPLSHGMQFGEVLTLWGAPKEKIEQEIKRRDIWVYRDSQVIFENGVVTSWINGRERGDEKVAVPVAQVPPKVEPDKSKINDQSVMEDILSEIMKEPSAPDTGENHAQQPAPPAVNVMRPEGVPGQIE